MNQLTEKRITCPYCGEQIEILLDPADLDQQYIEDCQVCCKPINFLVFESIDQELSVTVSSDDESSGFSNF
ncbi:MULTISPECIES: CPXCG motif-containing cysteine-rich protein [unclassified Pseudoalteromonas]|uniref:CPXCG motif-containing cysteine-rich protein n=2 Tax=Pseudoalteromonas TaxID=53246 RepID=UPI0010223DF9|nr:MULTISPECIES: CPXCG motif-containing cysteine-rich protein [unclassified Pseudoalteromonas]MCP4585199.1 CPXCG motif-containing cysteine-rich protein [Pseudoalteromonas sp.]QLE09402.1 CPXCG motif-containing cysteine-rich protein [Pseudoalteromonas shioyasakiensis]QWV05932.1 CPXCG motif-containing cysteine-rich protein [Pseudoalteromonas shioyasakiensis]RZD22788.1 CPXCG motif-containing cysteine-rich protein [Pseudoalteromonas sp. MEBiC 03485]